MLTSVRFLSGEICRGEIDNILERSGLFDSYQFFEDMLSNPGRFLNGTLPPNTTGAINACVFALNESTADPGNCTTVTGPAADSFLW